MKDQSDLRVRWLPGFEHAEIYDAGGYLNTIPRATVSAMASLTWRRAGNSWVRALDELHAARSREAK